MSKLTSSQISAGNVVIARAGWTGYVTEIETVENDFLNTATEKLVKRSTEVLTGYITSGGKNGSSFRCPLYMIGSQFEQIGIYRINQEGEITSTSKVIEKLPENTLAYNRRIGDSKVYQNEHLDKNVLNKINELIDAVNKLNGVYDNE